MSAEKELLEKWRELPQDKQQQVLEFVEFIHIKTVNAQLSNTNKSQLGKSLRQIRAKIVASGEPLLTQDEIEKEIASRRGGFGKNEA